MSLNQWLMMRRISRDTPTQSTIRPGTALSYTTCISPLVACDVDLHFELIHITCVGRCVTVFLTTPTGSSQGGS